jgi:hypothetical protein
VTSGRAIDPTYLGKLVILVHKGFTLPAIAAALDKTSTEIRSTMNNYGLKLKIEKETKKQIRADYWRLVGEGFTPPYAHQYLAKKYKVPKDSICRIMK